LIKKILILLFLGVATFQVNAQQLTRILFIFDASNSMNGKWEGATKIIRAREILRETITELEEVPNLEIALRVYGHQSPITPTYQDCDDTKLEVPFGTNNFAQIRNFIDKVEPKGTTPIARSLEASAADFPDANARNIIILITDGQEACDQFPCEVARELKMKGINVTPFVVGLGIDLKYLNDFDCIGRFYEASTMESFRKVMKSVLSDVLLNTTAQINLNDSNKQPNETETTVFLYEAGTKNLKYTFMHTINFKGFPDTITVIDPKLKYDMVVNTLPQVVVRNLSIQRNTHNILPAYCPQGTLIPRIKGNTKKSEVLVRVMQDGKEITLNVQRAGDIQKYLVGKYDLEVLTLPRIYMNDVTISQSTNTYIDILGAGQLTYRSSNPIVGQIFIADDRGQNDWVCDIDPAKLSANIYLQPGLYKIVYRLKSAVSTDYTTIKEFRIVSGDSVTLNL
jgi:Ca-activated chloride channel family protein